MSTYQHSNERIQSMLDKLIPSLTDDVHRSAKTYRETLTGQRQKSGTAKAWFQARHGQLVDTLQASQMGLWGPNGRVIDASRGTYVRLDGSIRDYKGLKVVHVTDDVLMVEDDLSMIIYVVTTES